MSEPVFNKEEYVNKIAAIIVSLMGEPDKMEQAIREVQEYEHMGPQMKSDIFEKAAEGFAILLDHLDQMPPPPSETEAGDAPQDEKKEGIE